MFDRVNHHTLCCILKRTVKEVAILDLINKFLKVGYISFEGLNRGALTNKVGAPQGSLLSPLLSNIYLNELDS